MALKLHCCRLTFVKGPHPCWQVQKALDETGVEYQIVKHPMIRGRRTALMRRTGQKLLPVIELPDGTVIREESRLLATRIRAGKLTDQEPER